MARRRRPIHRGSRIVVAIVGVSIAIVLVVGQGTIERAHAQSSRQSPANRSGPSSQTATPRGEPEPKADGTLVERGAYLVRVADCIACHSDPKSAPYAGGLGIHTPFGTIYSSNITPDAETGMGRYTKDEFTRVLREGIARDGSRLYPAMPYTNYTRMTQDDIDAIYAFLMQGVKPVHQAPPDNALPFPFDQRWLMRFWNVMFFRDGEYRADPAHDARWNRGAYIVQALGHCGACHTPRGLAGQEKSPAPGGPEYLVGGTLENWHANNLAANPGTGLESWSVDDIAEFLKSGRTTHVAAFGGMTQVIAESTQYMTDNDRTAVAVFLKSLGAADVKGKTVAVSADERTTAALRAADLDRTYAGHRGARLYLDNCNACHASNGRGAARIFPAPAGNPVVNSDDPTSLIHLVLAGSSMPSTHAAPAAVAMPGFGWRLTDAEVADVLDYIRTSWGNAGTPVATGQVADVRRAVAPQVAGVTHMVMGETSNTAIERDEPKAGNATQR